MGFRTVVIGKSGKLDYQLGYLVIRQDKTTKIFLDEISVLIIESTAVSLTAALLSELTKSKIKVIFCDERRNPSSELVSYYGSHDTSIKVKKQIDWFPEVKKSVWTEIVREKIKQQKNHLEFWEMEESKMLEKYISEIEFGDITNREGHAAKVYFNALYGMSFARTEENSINAALNYGYAIILSVFNREIVANGYLTQLGIFHDNMFNQFNLSCDFMEIFRPIVDYKVKVMAPIKFEHEEKMEILDILNLHVNIANRSETVLNAIKIYTKSLFDALNDRDISLIKFFKLDYGII